MFPRNPRVTLSLDRTWTHTHTHTHSDHLITRAYIKGVTQVQVRQHNCDESDKFIWILYGVAGPQDKSSRVTIIRILYEYN